MSHQRRAKKTFALPWCDVYFFGGKLPAKNLEGMPYLTDSDNINYAKYDAHHAAARNDG